MRLSVSFRFISWKYVLLFKPCISLKKSEIWSLFSPCRWYWFLMSPGRKEKLTGDQFKTIIGLKSERICLLWSFRSASHWEQILLLCHPWQLLFKENIPILDSYSLLEKFILILSWNVLLPNSHILFLVSGPQGIKANASPRRHFPSYLKIVIKSWHFLLFSKLSSFFLPICICISYVVISISFPSLNFTAVLW